MLEIGEERVGVVATLATPAALDALVVPGRAAPCRTAPDELLLLCAPDVASEIVREVTDRVRAGDPDALVLDVTDGWTAITLTGDGSRDAFAYLSPLELPSEGSLQGEVVAIPAKVLVEADRIHVLASSMYEAHLRDRVRRRLAHLRPGEAVSA